MPLYEYQCDACGKRFEVIQKFSDQPAETCTICGKGPVHRLLSSPAIHFKGSGWYITDYAQKGKPDSGSASAGTTDKTEGKTETKSETTPAPSSTSSTPKS